MAGNTKKPTGPKISRSGNKFTFEWKRGETYKKQALKWALLKSTVVKLPVVINGRKQYINAEEIEEVTTSVDIGASAERKTITLTPNSYFPNGDVIVGVKFYVRGKANNKNWSDWNDKTFKFEIPNAPTLTPTWNSAHTNVTNFSWAAESNDTAHEYFTDVAYQSILVEDCSTENGAELNWSNATVVSKSATGDYDETENTSSWNVESYSFTRWVRVCARGPAGASEYVYAKHVYAKANPASNVDAEVIINPDGSQTIIVENEDDISVSNPSDTTEYQYAIVTPLAGLACPSDDSIWETYDTQKSGRASSVQLSLTVGTDKCEYIRVNQIHDNNKTAGTPVLVQKGPLAMPTQFSLSDISDTNHTLTVSATNNSEVPDSYLAFVYVPASNPANSVVVAVSSVGSGAKTKTNVKCPNWSTEAAYAIEVYAVVGPYTTSSRSDGVTAYNITEQMKSSSSLREGGTVPTKPTNVKVKRTAVSGTVQVTWDWSWADADGAEISWSDHEDAWESTDEPDTFTISRNHASKWNIADLETGKVWYIRVRLISGIGDAAVYGPYSDISSNSTINLSSVPNKPLLKLSAAVITQNDTVTAAWVYSTDDNALQEYAEIKEVTKTTSGFTYGTRRAETQSAQHAKISAKEAGWALGSTHNLAVRVRSASGSFSEWSDPVSVMIAPAVNCTISATSLVSETITEDDSSTRTVKSLKAMPFTFTITGAGTSGITTAVIERAEDYHITRPDGSETDGYEGETIAIKRQIGQTQITVNSNDLLGRLDDGAQYRLVATVQDSYGQSSQASIDFEVHWTHQALMITSVTDVISGDVAIITPSAPTGAIITDSCDIYRLSADKPQLIYKGAEFGERYVDPYPTIGATGGHRVVFITANGDYATSSGLAITDKTDNLYESEYGALIDFPDGTVHLDYNVDVSSNWTKDFLETKYLGGSIQGDWNAAVSRKGSVATVMLTLTDKAEIDLMRKLAEYTGICHVRTHDGSNYCADVQVQESYDHNKRRMFPAYTLTITKVDYEKLDGVLYDDWVDE